MLFQFRVTFLCQRIRTIYFKKHIPHCGTSIPHISAINLKGNGIGFVMTIQLVFVASPLSIKEKKADWMARNQDNMSEWSDMSIRGLLFL